MSCPQMPAKLLDAMKTDLSEEPRRSSIWQIPSALNRNIDPAWRQAEMLMRCSLVGTTFQTREADFWQPVCTAVLLQIAKAGASLEEEDSKTMAQHRRSAPTARCSRQTEVHRGCKATVVCFRSTLLEAIHIRVSFMTRVMTSLEALLLAGSVHAELNLTRVLERSHRSVIEDDSVMQ